jgi:hypothetical protein
MLELETIDNEIIALSAKMADEMLKFGLKMSFNMQA